MDSVLPTLAFSLLIGGQFLAAIVLITNRKTIYGIASEVEPRRRASKPPVETIAGPSMPLQAS